MARTSDPHSATAQFFINVADNDFLDHKAPSAQGWGYCVFGKVVGGQGRRRQDQAASRPAARGMHENVPTDDVVIDARRGSRVAARAERAPVAPAALAHVSADAR